MSLYWGHSWGISRAPVCLTCPKYQRSIIYLYRKSIGKDTTSVDSFLGCLFLQECLLLSVRRSEVCQDEIMRRAVLLTFMKRWALFTLFLLPQSPRPPSPWSDYAKAKRSNSEARHKACNQCKALASDDSVWEFFFQKSHHLQFLLCIPLLK